MKISKITLISATLTAIAGVASGQSFIAGLDFKDGTEKFDANTGFDTGVESGSFTLNMQSNADDNFAFGDYTQGAWAAQGESYTDGSNSYAAGNFSQIPVTVQLSANGGAAASTALFGGTSANAQGFSSTNAIAFGANDDGFFTIGVGTSSLGGGFDNLSLNFDVGAFAVDSQSAGTLLVNGQSINVTSSYANQTVNLGNVTAGSLITFDLTGLDGGATYDNFMFSGVAAVPEPSSFAAIAGVLAIGFVGLRRRR